MDPDLHMEGVRVQDQVSAQKPGVFLTAEWKNLVMMNYMVDPGLLRKLLPAGTELDLFQEQAYVSLIGFEFNQTRVHGVAIPFHSNFEEVNLRFYVKRFTRRGVVFIREFVPKRAIAAAARFLYGEKYLRVPMAHSIRIDPGRDSAEVEYSWGSGASRCFLRIETQEPSFLPVEGSLSQFITEHYWGYTPRSSGGCREYEVQHPQWLAREAKRAEFSGDATRFYGDEFGKVLERPPDSALLAEGSAVTVFRGSRIA